MADENNNTPATPAAAPAVPVTERAFVPVSALFDENELRMPEPVVNDGAKPTDTPPAAPVAPAAITPPATPPAEPAKPTDTPPAAPAAATPPATPPAAPKIKVGDKEYTEAELKAALETRAKNDNKPTAPTAPAPAAPAPKQPTPEEIATNERNWQSKFIADEKLAFNPTTEEMETILSGGDDAVKLFGAKLTDAVSKAVMLARKSIYNDLNPTLSRIQSNIEPLLVNSSQVEAAAAEQQFSAAYPEYKEHMQVVRDVGMALLQRYPNEMSAMTREQQLAEVAAQSDAILQRQYAAWNPGATGSWKDAAKVKPTTAPVTPPATPAAAAATPAATPPATPAAAAPAKPAITPPASNSPSGVPTGTPGKDWHKDTAKSLQD